MKQMRNIPLAAGLGILFAASMAACGGGAADGMQAEIQNISLEDAGEENVSPKNAEGEAAAAGGDISAKDGADAASEEGGQDTEAYGERVEEEESVDRAADASEQEGLSGKIQILQEDGMTIAQTTVWEDQEAGLIKLVDEKDAEKISVRFAEDVKVQYWRIEGGGAGIDMQDRTLSDLAVGIIVEMEGYYEGDVYVATLILMEEYV